MKNANLKFYSAINNTFTGQAVARVILDFGSAIERRHYNVTSSNIGWAHTQNEPCNTNMEDTRSMAKRIDNNMTNYDVNQGIEII